jgi:type IV fimbrial biogenesis protein FimT
MRHANGYTLVELMVVIAILGVLVAVGTPMFKYVTGSNRVSSEVNRLLGDMQFARSQAVKLGQTVTVCASSDGVTCSNVGWQNGWIVFLDMNSNQTVDANETIIRVQPAFTGSDTFAPPSGVTFWAATYNRMGYAPTGSTTTINLQLHDSTNNQQWTRCLAINPIGTPVTERYGAGTPACN